MTRDWVRLARYAEARRAELGGKPKSAVMNPGTYRRLEYWLTDDPRKGKLSERSLRLLEIGLDWETFSADAALSGGEPRAKGSVPELASLRAGDATRSIDDRPDDAVAAFYVTVDGRMVVGVAGATEADRRDNLRRLARLPGGEQSPGR